MYPTVVLVENISQEEMEVVTEYSLLPDTCKVVLTLALKLYSKLKEQPEYIDFFI